MPAETVAAKAARLVESDAVTYLETIDEGDGVHRYAVKGDTAAYDVLTSGVGDTTCDCPAKTKCAHIAAVELTLTDDVEDGEVVDGSVVSPETRLEHQLAIAEPEHVARHRALYRELATLKGQDFIPRQYRDAPAKMFAAALMGEEYGLGPMQSLRAIDVMDSGAEPNAELKLALFYRAGHSLIDEEWSPDGLSVTVTGKRGDTGQEYTATYSAEDAAKQGKVTVKDGKVTARSKQGKAMPWEASTEDLVWAGVVRRLVRRLAPDALTVRTTT